MIIEDTRVTVAPPNTLLTVTENKYCVVLNGTVKVKTSHSYREIGPRSIFKMEGMICSGEKGCQIIIFDPNKHQLPVDIRQKIRQIAEEERHTDDNNEPPSPDANQLVYDKRICCPVCGTDFTAKKVRTGKLKSMNLDSDLRMHYEGINPLLYSVIICPECFYANLSEDFAHISPAEKSKLSSVTRTARQGHLTELETAIENYKLAIKCIQAVNGTPDRLAKACLHLAWLYEDAGEDTQSSEMRQNALSYYKQAFSSSSHLNQSQLEQVIYLIGELSLQLGNKKEAYGYFQQLIQKKDTAPWLMKLTRERLFELRNQASS